MYYPKLDSVRCFAAFAVVFAHIFMIWTWHPDTVTLFPLGNLGVIVFFGLSGFLITSILLAEPLDQPLGQSFKNFYMRRTLRIFPIYYLYLLVAFSIDLHEIRNTGAWPWAYLTNIFIFKENEWLNSNSPLWSLSVEEQFYLVWPFIVLFLREKVKTMCAIFIAICVISAGTRLYLFLNGYSASPQIEVFTFANLDFLAIGGLLAIARHRFGDRLNRYGLPLLAGGVIFYYITCYLPDAFEAVYWTFGKFSIGVATVGLILYSIGSKNRWTLLHNPVTIHLGKISYGIYLYHNPLVSYYKEIALFIGIDPGDSQAAKAVICVTLVLILAQLSYMYIEKPLLSLKDRFRSVPAGLRPGGNGNKGDGQTASVT